MLVYALLVDARYQQIYQHFGRISTDTSGPLVEASVPESLFFLLGVGRLRTISEGDLVPDEGIEPPTFGLQNRCSTAELIRRFGGFCAISEPSRAQERG
jgi:hypothetical protein